MEKLKLFQVACVERGVDATPTSEAIPDRVISDAPALMLARDERDAAVKAALALPPLLQCDRQRLEVLVRPF